MHRCKINNKVYIGQTSRTISRRSGLNGQNYLRKNKNNKDYTKFANAIIKYGWDNFYHIVLDTAETHDEADKKEMLYIKKYDSLNNGYNSTSGGNSKHKISDISRKRLSESHKKENLSIQAISNYSKCHIGKTPTKGKHYKLISDSKKGNKNPMYHKIPWNYNKHPSEKTIEKMKNCTKGSKSVRAKKVIGKNIKTNEEIVFGSLSEAAKYVNLKNPTSITSCCKNRQIQSAGFTWRYEISAYND